MHSNEIRCVSCGKPFKKTEDNQIYCDLICQKSMFVDVRNADKFGDKPPNKECVNSIPVFEFPKYIPAHDEIIQQTPARLLRHTGFFEAVQPLRREAKIKKRASSGK